VTPFREDRFDADAFRANIDALNATRLAGYVVLGSNGESAYVSDDEAIEIVEVAADARADGKFLVVGTGRESTRATIDLTRRAAAAGAEAALVVPPSYYRASMTEPALDAHYRSIADAVDIPILLYHVPKFAPVRFTPELVAGLASHPNIRGMKDTSADLAFLTRCLAERPDGFRVWVGTANILLPGLALGADGGVLALANIAPDECVALCDHVAAGELDIARQLQYRLLPINQAVTTRFGVPGLKHALDLIGLRGGEPRRPLTSLSAAQRSELREVLVRGGLLPAC